jgi:hydroxyacylglutathione hydrolase
MQVITVPCRRDNFTFLVGLPGRPEVAVVDPCEPDPVLDSVRAHGLRVVAILNTHHHGDHVGGNERVCSEFPGIDVYAHSSDHGRIPGQTVLLEEGDSVAVAGLSFEVLFVPGHTRGHIAYVTDGAAFVGDTLFGAGCGRLFEGTAQQLYESLNFKLARLPDRTRVYFAHEYTASNLRFAAHVEPDNAEIAKRQSEVAQRRAAGEWTTPSELGLEKQTNPFLRLDVRQVRSHVGLDESAPPERVFAALRAEKDKF